MKRDYHYTVSENPYQKPADVLAKLLHDEVPIEDDIFADLLGKLDSID